MYKYILQSVEGVQWFGIVPLVIFFIFFTTVFLRTFLRDKRHFEAIEQLPLNDD